MKKILHILIVALFSLSLVSCGVFENTLKKAEKGDVEAQYTLGVKYEDAEGVPQDSKQAAYWYTKAAKLTPINQAVWNPSHISEPMIYDDGWKTLTDMELAERIQRPVLNINTGKPFNFKVVDKNDNEVGRVKTPAEYYQQIRDGNKLYISTTYDQINAGLFESVAMPLFYFSKATQSKHSYVRDFPFDDHDPLTVLPVEFINWRGSDQRVVVEKASEENKPWRDIAPNARILNAIPSELKIYDTFFEDMYDLPNEERYNGNQASHILQPAVIGDLNNDGYEDIVLDCARYNVGYSGRSYYFVVLTRKSPNGILEDITDEVDKLILNSTSNKNITNIERQTETKDSRSTLQRIESEWAINEKPTTNRVDKFINQHFEDYKAQIYKDKIHLPKWISNNSDGTWSDNLGKGVGEPMINFAGKYFIESHSCGTECSYFTLTDLSTGRDLDLLSIFNNGEDTIINRNGIYRYKTNLSFRPDSYMLVARKCSYSSPYDGNGEEKISCYESAYLLNNGKLTKIVSNTDKNNIDIAKDTELSPRQIQIIQTVLNPDGYISKELHSEFWGLMPVEERNKEQTINFIADFIEKNFVYGINFIREGWASMKASIEAGRIMKTPGYESAKIKFYASAPQQARQKIQESIDNAEEMIKAAAYRKPFQTDRGTIYITPEMVDQVIAGFDASSSRVRRLMNLEWEKKIKEYLYPEAHVAILSDSPFAVERKRLVAQNQKRIEMVTLTNQRDENTTILITFSHYGSVFRDPEGAVKRNVESIITASGATVSSLYSSLWRTLLSAKGDGELKTSDGTLFFSVRSVELLDQKGILSLMVASSASKIEANLSLKQLEQSLQIIK